MRKMFWSVSSFFSSGVEFFLSYSSWLDKHEEVWWPVLRRLFLSSIMICTLGGIGVLFTYHSSPTTQYPEALWSKRVANERLTQIRAEESRWKMQLQHIPMAEQYKLSIALEVIEAEKQQIERKFHRGGYPWFSPHWTRYPQLLLFCGVVSLLLLLGLLFGPALILSLIASGCWGLANAANWAATRCPADSTA